MICHAPNVLAERTVAARRSRLESSLRRSLGAAIDATVASHVDLARAAAALIDDAVRSEASRIAIDDWDATSRRETYLDAADALRRLLESRSSVPCDRRLRETFSAIDVLTMSCPDEAEVFVLRVLAGRTLDEVAEMTESPRAVAERRWHFARAWASAAVTTTTCAA